MGELRNPIVLILLFATGVSAVTQEWVDAVIILAIVLGSALLSFFQEYRANNAAEELRARVQVRATVLRDGQPQAIPAEQVVPGDVVLLPAGSLIPADGVLLERDLAVLRQGTVLGRTTFANTLKYVFITTSANFGNMFSMAGASLFLPFLPMLPLQILLTNFLTDFPAMTITGDSVDLELIERPRRWNVGFIRDFMVTFGLASSVFDYVTFGGVVADPPSNGRSIPHSLVPGVSLDRTVHPAGHPHPAAIL